MASLASVLIIGDGTAGTVVANKLKFLAGKRAEVRVVGNSQRHYYKGDFMFIPLKLKDYKECYKPPEFLFNAGIDYVKEEVVRVNVDQRLVTLRSGRTLSYDYLVIASGARLAPEEVPGFEGEARHFYTLQRAMELQEYMDSFQGGNLVIGQCAGPISYPSSTFEFALMARDYLESKGLLQKSKIHFLMPSLGIYSDSSTAGKIASLLGSKGIEVHKEFEVNTVNPKNKEVISVKGEKLNYSLLVAVPPHRGQRFVKDSSLGDDMGFIEVDRNTLNLKEHPEVFVAGDAAKLPIDKTGSAAHFQATYIANRIAMEVGGNYTPSTYMGENAFNAATSVGRGMTFYSSYSSSPKATFESMSDFLIKWTYSSTYFSSVVRGLI